MFFIIGLLVVIGSVLGGYMPHGDIRVLWQPLEVLIIMGGAIGAFIIGNPKPVLIGTVKQFGRVLKGAPYSKDNYLELLTLLYSLFKLANSKGALALEPHIENPEESTLFQEYPNFNANHHAVEFLCDTMRLITMGSDDPHQLEAMMDEDIEVLRHESDAVAHAVTNMSDGLPAFGIVAAVLGVIVTMGSISEPPEVLGVLIGGALVGTFLGILMAYGIFGPIGRNLEGYAEAEIKYFHCLKAGIIAHAQGNAPAISIEYARKILVPHDRPTFSDVEEAVENVLPA